MSTYLYNRLEKTATLKIIIFGLLIIVLFNIVLLPMFPKLFQVEIDIAKVLDLQFSYKPEFVYAFFTELGEEGRNAYLLSEVFVDFPYLIIYTFLYILLLIRLLSISKIKSKKWILYLPFLVGLFDALENIGIVQLLTSYPNQLPNLVIITSVFTTLKWIFAFGTLIAVLFLSVTWLLKKNKK